MKIIFGAQGSFTNIYYDVYKYLRDNNLNIKSATFLTSDSHYYYGKNS